MFICAKGNLPVTWQSSERLHLRVLIWEQMPAENIQRYKNMTKFHRDLSESPQKDERCKNFASSRLEEVRDFFL